MRSASRPRNSSRSGLWWLLSCSLLLLAASVGAAPVPLSEYFRETWGTREGLPHNTINAMAQTPEGYLWVASWEGPARFNGRGFTVYDHPEDVGLPDSGTRTLTVDRDGVLLVGGVRGGLTERRAEGWQGHEPVAGLVVSLHRDRAGRLWVGSEANGLVRIDPDGTRRRWIAPADLPGPGVPAIAEDAEGRLWFASTGGLLLLDGGRLTRVPADAGLPDLPVTALTLAPDGVLYVGTEAGVYRRDAGGRFLLLAAELAAEPISQLLAEADGGVWVGTVNAGLFRVSTLGVERLDVAEGLPNSRVLSLLRDRERSLWVGTNGGLMRLRDAPLSSYTSERGLADDFVRSVLAHRDGSLWVGSSRGVSRFGPAGLERVGLGTALEQESVLSFAEASNGDVWIGTFASGALRVRAGAIVERIDREDGLPANEVRGLVETADGSLWIATARGVMRWQPDRPPLILTEAEGLPGNFSMSLMADQQGSVWIGTGLGVAIHDGTGLRRLPLDQVDAAYAFAFHEDVDRGQVWIATDRGLVRYRRADGSLRRVGREAGLPYEKIFSITLDAEDAFWLSGNRGVVRISRREADAVADGQLAVLAVEHYGESDGMASAQCNGGSGPAAARRQDGSIWFATAGGVASVRPERMRDFARYAPPVVIERAALDGRELSPTDGLRLPSGGNRLEIEFAGLGFVMPQRIRYRYRLEGFDPDWVERGNLTSAELTNLPPGDYVFRVEAAYPRGQWSEQGAHWRFSVAPRLWQRLELQALGGFALFGLIALGLRWRTRSLRQRAEQLATLVERRTADLNRQTEQLRAADVERNALLERLREQAEAFERQAHEDALTGLANRRAFDSRLAEAVATARRDGAPLCLALIDIDYFKRINDRYSHAAGDEALKAISHALRSQSRGASSVARWGGEEFAVLLPGTQLDAGLAAAERLRGAIEAIDCAAFAPGLKLAASIGVASDAGYGSHERLLARADAALYRAKQSGRNRVCGESEGEVLS